MNKLHKYDPQKAKKDDITVQSPIEQLVTVMDRQTQKERKLKMLRVSNSTVILVSANKCNDKYREWYRQNRMGLK